MIEDLSLKLKGRGVDFIKLTDISSLPANLNQGYSVALLIGVLLSPEYIHRLSVENIFDEKEFSEKESFTDELAEWAAGFITAKGYKAFAQSEKVLLADGFYDKKIQTTLLPHKTIALIAGLGWIGKNNLLVSPEYGCAFSMCTILTNAPLQPKEIRRIKPSCGNCTVCIDACDEKALSGSDWKSGIGRDQMLDFKRCTLCLKCLAKCPWTQKYMKGNYKNNSGDIN